MMPDYTEPTNITTDSSTGAISVRFPHGVVTWHGRGKDTPPPLRVRGLVGVKGISNALAANPDITQGQIGELKSILLTPSKGSIRRAFTNGILATAHEIIALGGDAIHTLWGGAFPGQSAVITSYGSVLERQFDKYSIGRPNELEAFRRTGTLLLYLAGGVLGDVGVNAAGTNENESLNFIGSEAWRSRVRRVRSSIAYYAPDLTAVVPFFTPYYNQLRQGYAQLLEERGENEFVRLSANSVFRQSLFDLVVERMAE